MDIIEQKNTDALKALYSTHIEKFQWLKENKQQYGFNIIDTCRLDNQKILSLGCLGKLTLGSPGPFVAFIPAAGAASRYFAELTPLITALKNKDLPALSDFKKHILSNRWEAFCLPSPIRLWIQGQMQLNDETMHAMRESLEHPKALQPCHQNGETFFNLKRKEHQKMVGISAEIYAINEKSLSPLENINNQIDSTIPCHFLLQDESMSTLRLNENGMPLVDADQQTSMVPAGHGALVQLFPKVYELFPSCHSLFIRNIDNILQEQLSAYEYVTAFLQIHEYILNTVRKIRTQLQNNEIKQGAYTAICLAEQLKIKNWSYQLPPEEQLWQLQALLFHTSSKNNRDIETLKDLYERPVNTFGQVPNSRKDMGGMPVMASYQGQELKLCIEGPHINSTDQAMIIEHPEIVTHFNPSFVCAELLPGDYYSNCLSEHPFWVFAKKSYLGKPVYYYESLLYELLGNSLMSNLIFVEIPRLLFNPHKSFLDKRF